MMNDFQYLISHSKMETEKTTIQKEFLDFRNMMELHEQLFDQTIASQLKSYDEKMSGIMLSEKDAAAKARVKYKKFFDDSEGDDEERHSWASHQSGLDYIHDDAYMQKMAATELLNKHLDSIRKSMIVTVYSLIESSLISICEMAHREFNTKLKISHLNSKNYIKAAFDYLDLVVELNQRHYLSYYEKLSEYQNLRNCIVHNNSIMTLMDRGKLSSNFKKSIETIDKSNDLAQLTISDNTIVKDFFVHGKLIMENIHWALEEKLLFKPIKERCKLWFNILAGDVEIFDFKADKKSENKIEIEFLFSSVSEKIKEMKCHVIVNSRQGKSKVLENKTESKVIDAFIDFTHKHSGVLFNGVFDLVYFSKPSIKVTVEFLNR